MNRLETISRAVDRWVVRLLFILGISMTVIVALQVFCRYGLNRSLFWSEELARYLMVWLTFLGATTAYRRGMHPGVDVLTTRMPSGLRRGFALLVHLISMAFFLAMVVYGIEFAHFVRLQISPALGLPKWIVLGAIPVAGAVLMIHTLVRLAQEVSGSAGDR
jgi:TRAP-type C4-dicarboxylate transport system permease small subunit